MEVFTQGLPGYPDNIRFDGEGHYWIAMPSVNIQTEILFNVMILSFGIIVCFSLFLKGVAVLWKLAFRYPFLRKLTAIAANYGLDPLIFMANAGVLGVDLDGKPIALYHDHKLSHMTTGVKIGRYLYCGSLLHSHIVRLDLLKYPAQKRL